ncbi:c-type heme family protein [Aureliella helgolandensis]|uniref:Tll0287-like domain-containing protein n=1 Tax=Aureliella helgolandensis TaxID=2527968 RepID=A0A518G3G3_9BACT|nr:DUF3365 domain-containing protein [Aureliella helgolandensis]QDV23124.1 hypothetical protein Q31a_14200 [Aureliella helgolandensis]
MKSFVCAFSGVALLGTTLALVSTPWQNSIAQEKDKVAKPADETTKPSEKAIERSRKTVRMLDNIFKQTIVMVTDKYVHDDDDFAAGSAAVLLFKNVSESGENKVRLLDATGDPYEPENVAKNDFEREGIRRIKAGAATHEQVVALKDGSHQLRMVTAVPVVMEKCIMCHAHYADVKPGEAIGVISYTIPIE